VVAAGDEPRLHNLLAGLAIAAGTPPVTVALVDDAAPNALAVGRSPRDTTVVVTSGLVQKLTRDQLEAVLAVEVCAIRRLDIALRSVAMASTAGAYPLHNMLRSDLRPGRSWYERLDWSGWLMMFVTWPTMMVASLLRRSVQRSSDFGADEMAITITRHPDALRSALQALQDDDTVLTPHGPMHLGLRTPSMGPPWIEPIPEDEADVPHELKRLVARPGLQTRLQHLSDRLG